MKKALLLVLLFCLVNVAPAFAMNVQEVTGRKSGVTAWLVEDHKFPVVALRLAFQGGVEQDPADKQGLAALATRALVEGAGPYSASAFQQELSDKSISLAFGAERDALVGGLKCLSEDKTTAFEMLRVALTEPRFDRADIERLRHEQLAAMKAQFTDPNWQARVALFSKIYPNHPYAQRRLGTMKTLNAITRDDIRDFAARSVARDNLVVAVAGDMTASELSLALDKIFVGLPKRSRLAAVADVPEASDAPAVLVKRDGTQSAFVFALPGPKRDDRDFYAAQITNYILGGGGFASRLMQDVRDKKGLTYGISTDLAPSEHAGNIIGGMSVDNNKAAEALDSLRRTMRGFYTEGPTVREIAAAKDYLTGAMPLNLTSTDKIAAFLVYMQRENLGIDYIDRYPSLIRNVGSKDVARVLDRFFNPDKMALAVAGKPEGIAVTEVREPEVQ